MIRSKYLARKRLKKRLKERLIRHFAKRMAAPFAKSWGYAEIIKETVSVAPMI